MALDFPLAQLPPTAPSVIVRSNPQSANWPGRDYGTGGGLTLYYVQNRTTGYGFPLLFVSEANPRSSDTEVHHVDLASPFVAPMRSIKDAFGRTFTHLPKVFGVSRQTLYNWLGGEYPKAAHHGRILALAAVADAFRVAGFTPSAEDLRRTVAEGKNLLQLVAAGEDGRTAAEKLMRIIRRGLESQSRLEALLARSTVKDSPEAANLTAPAVDESAG